MNRRRRQTQTQVEYGQIRIRCSACNKKLGTLICQYDLVTYDLGPTGTATDDRVEWSVCPRETCGAKSLRASKAKLEALGAEVATNPKRRHDDYLIGGRTAVR